MGMLFLGMGILVDPSRIKVVSKWPPPKSVTKACNFLSLASYYRRFVEGFMKLVAPLTTLTQNDKEYEWTAKCEEIFQELKKRPISVLILIIPADEEEFDIYSNASKEGLRVVLMQKGKVVAYASRQLKEDEKNYPTQIWNLSW